MVGSRVVARTALRLPTGGSAVLLAVPLAAAAPFTKLPMPIHKAMASPASSPTTAPCDTGQRRALAPAQTRGAPHSHTGLGDTEWARGH